MPSGQWKHFNCYEVPGTPPTGSPQEIGAAYRETGLRHPVGRPYGDAVLRAHMDCVNIRVS